MERKNDSHIPKKIRKRLQSKFQEETQKVQFPQEFERRRKNAIFAPEISVTHIVLLIFGNLEDFIPYEAK